MNSGRTKAILVVSFGTSVNETRRLTIDAIEQSIRAAYPQFRVYRAWTSKIICKKVYERDGAYIDSVAEAFLRMEKDGVSDVAVQPTYVVGGVENEQMQGDALRFSPAFSSIRFGDPLLTSDDDIEAMAGAVEAEFSFLSGRDMLVLMGHGTASASNRAYEALDSRLKSRGLKNAFLGTAESDRGLCPLLHAAASMRPDQIYLAPFLIAAGAHALKDMSGDGENSWKSRFTAEGYRVTCMLKGLGEYPAVRSLLVRHVGRVL